MQRHVASVSYVFCVAKNLRNPKSLAYSLAAVAGHSSPNFCAETFTEGSEGKEQATEL